MAKVFSVSAVVMVADSAKPNEPSRSGDPVDYFLPDADEKATRSALIAALKDAGFERVNNVMRLECATIEFHTKEMRSHSHDRLVVSVRDDPSEATELPVDEAAIKDLLRQLFRAYPEVAVERGIDASGDRREHAQGEGRIHLTVIQNDGSNVVLSATEDTKKSLLIRLIEADSTRAVTTWQEEYGSGYRRG